MTLDRSDLHGCLHEVLYYLKALHYKGNNTVQQLIIVAYSSVGRIDWPTIHYT